MRTFLGLVASCALVAGCADFAPVNPYDPRYQVQVGLTGPDSATSDGEILTFTVATEPVWTAGPGVWKSSAPGRLVPLGDGRFRVAQANYQGNSDTISIAFGPHTASKVVRVRQRISSIRLSAAYAGHPDSLWLGALAEGVGFGYQAYDSSGATLQGFAPPLQLTTRDPAVVRVSGDSAISVVNGRTWVVAVVDGARDSLAIVVRQYASTFDCLPQYEVYVPLNDSTRIAAGTWRDPLGTPLASPPPTDSMFVAQWRVDSASLSVAPDGLVRIGSKLTEGIIVAGWRYPDGFSGVAGSCFIYGGYTKP